MSIYSLSVLFFSFCSLLLGLLVLLKRGDLVGKLYFSFAISASGWAFCFSLLINPYTNYEMALLSARLANLAALFIPAAWLHLCLVLADSIKKNKKYLLFIYGVTFLLVSISMTPWFVATVKPIMEFRYYTRPGPIYFAFFTLFYIVIPSGFWHLFKHLKKATGEEKRQLRGFFWTTAISFIGGSPTFFPVFEIPFPQYAIFLMPIYPFGMAYFLIRERLFSELEMVQAAHRDKLAAIGTIATSINHEIRNPLYIIHGLAESFLHNFRGEEKNLQAVKDESVAVLEKTAQQAKRAMEIMSQFSLFARQHVRGGVTVAESTNLQECLDNVLPLVRHEMMLDKIAFESRLPHELPPIKANPRQIEEVLFNLLVNACQALKSKGGNITICAAASGERVTVRIEDDGPGIPQPQLKKIFEPFYTTKDEGTGLGLYIVKHLVEKSGGKISVESEIGKGTRFVLEFSI